MKKLVRQRSNHLYLSVRGSWTRNVAEAEAFGSVIQAIDRINGLNLVDCEIVFKASQDGLDLILPVVPAKPTVAFSPMAQLALEQV